MNTATEELELLAIEISEVRDILRELSQQVLRIERRVQASLPRPAKKQPKVSERKKVNETDAWHIIDKLTESAKNGEQIETKLRSMTVKGGVAVLAKALGLTNSKQPPKDELIRRVSTRLRQRAAVQNGICGSDPKRETELSQSPNPSEAS